MIRRLSGGLCGRLHGLQRLVRPDSQGATEVFQRVCKIAFQNKRFRERAIAFHRISICSNFLSKVADRFRYLVLAKKDFTQAHMRAGGRQFLFQELSVVNLGSHPFVQRCQAIGEKQAAFLRFRSRGFQFVGLSPCRALVRFAQQLKDIEVIGQLPRSIF